MSQTISSASNVILNNFFLFFDFHSFNAWFELIFFSPFSQASRFLPGQCFSVCPTCLQVSGLFPLTIKSKGCCPPHCSSNVCMIQPQMIFSKFLQKWSRASWDKAQKQFMLKILKKRMNSFLRWMLFWIETGRWTEWPLDDPPALWFCDNLSF